MYVCMFVCYVCMLCMLCYVMLCYVMLCYVMLCYVMLCYVMLCYVMLCYVMLCYVCMYVCMYIYLFTFLSYYIHFLNQQTQRLGTLFHPIPGVILGAAFGAFGAVGACGALVRWEKWKLCQALEWKLPLYIGLWFYISIYPTNIPFINPTIYIYIRVYKCYITLW